MNFPPCNLTEMTEALFMAGLKTPPLFTAAAQPMTEAERAQWMDSAIARLLLRYDMNNWQEEQASMELRAKILGHDEQIIFPDNRIVH